jgi:iron complex outermembrane receptor protein
MWWRSPCREAPLRQAAASTHLRRSLLALLALSQSAAAQPPDTATQPPVLMEPVVVTATRLPQPLLDVPAAISVVDAPDIHDARPTVSLDEPLNRVPGVFVQNSGNYAQDYRVQIRGFGTRAGFGTREIKVLVDGLPLTLPDGQTQLDDLDLDAIGRIEVLRSPASALYGNASGGVIQLFTEDAPVEPGLAVRATGGSYALQKYSLKGGGRAGAAQAFVQASYFSVDGFREHSAAQSTIINAKLRYDLTPSTDITLLLNGVDAPVAQDPGALTRAEADRTPRLARSLNVLQNAGEAVEQGRIGAVVDQRLEHGGWSGYVYALYRDFDNSLPIPPTTPAENGGIVTFYRFSPGGGLQYTYASPLWHWEQLLTAGADMQYQDDLRRRYANLRGKRGTLGLQQREQVTSVGPYLQEQLFVLENLELTLGLRYDRVYYDVDVQVPADSGSSGSRALHAWSPAGGIRYSWPPGLAVFANVGTAFQVPTTTELANPAGAGFNSDLEPQQAISYELGARAELERVTAGAAAYWIDLRDALVPFELPDQPERTYFRNAGRSRRYGMELDWQAQIVSGLRWTTALTLIDAQYIDYTTPAGTFDGNAEPGIPPFQAYNELFYRHPSGAYAAFEAFAVEGYFVNDANTASTSSYALLTLRAGFDGTFGRWRIGPFIGFNNLLDQNYDGTVRLNATMERFFEPAPGFNVYGGLTVGATL